MYIYCLLVSRGWSYIEQTIQVELYKDSLLCWYMFIYTGSLEIKLILFWDALPKLNRKL